MSGCIYNSRIFYILHWIGTYNRQNEIVSNMCSGKIFILYSKFNGKRMNQTVSQSYILYHANVYDRMAYLPKTKYTRKWNWKPNHVQLCSVHIHCIQTHRLRTCTWVCCQKICRRKRNSETNHMVGGVYIITICVYVYCVLMHSQRTQSSYRRLTD